MSNVFRIPPTIIDFPLKNEGAAAKDLFVRKYIGESIVRASYFMRFSLHLPSGLGSSWFNCPICAVFLAAPIWIRAWGLSLIFLRINKWGWIFWKLGFWKLVRQTVAREKKHCLENLLRQFTFAVFFFRERKIRAKKWNTSQSCPTNAPPIRPQNFLFIASKK